MEAQLLAGNVNGGSLVLGLARFKDEGDRWQLWGSLCYVKDGAEECHGDVWLPKDSLEICVSVNLFSAGSLLALFGPATSCSGHNDKRVSEVTCW